MSLASLLTIVVCVYALIMGLPALLAYILSGGK